MLPCGATVDLAGRSILILSAADGAVGEASSVTALYRALAARYRRPALEYSEFAEVMEESGAQCVQSG
jgi:hypothetical protein